MPKPKTKAQAAYLGAIAGGITTNPRITKTEAHDMLRGTHIKTLPSKARSTRKKQR
jgi:hypothetical protein